MTELNSVEQIPLPSLQDVQFALTKLRPGASGAELKDALEATCPSFPFTVIEVGDEYWLSERSVLSPDGERLGPYPAWITAELARENGKVRELWTRLRASDLALTEWRGHTVFAFSRTDAGHSDFIQISFGRETEWRTGPIMPDWAPSDAEGFLDPFWVRHAEVPEDPVITDARYRLLGATDASIVHMRSFLERCARTGRQRSRRSLVSQQEAPREIRFFEDWAASSASRRPIFAYWGFDIRDHESGGHREVGFIPRPLRQPSERLRTAEGVSVHALMDRIEAIDRELDLTFGWFFLMTHGNWVDTDVGRAIAAGLRQQRIRLPDRDAQVLLRWDDDFYAF